MSHSFTNITIHLIFHVKNTESMVKESHLSELFQYVGGVIRAMSGRVYLVGGRPDHLHILTSLPMEMSVPDFVRSIKANASRWIKGLDVCYNCFAWQKGYGAFSVSESSKEAVMQYIANQKEHHTRQSSVEEFNVFLRKNGLLGENKS